MVVKRGIPEFTERYDVDAVIRFTMTHDYEDRKRSTEFPVIAFDPEERPVTTTRARYPYLYFPEVPHRPSYTDHDRSWTRLQLLPGPNTCPALSCLPR